jgi:hypothetical protein
VTVGLHCAEVEVTAGVAVSWGTVVAAISVTLAIAVNSTAVACALGSEETGTASDGPVTGTCPEGMLQELSSNKSTTTKNRTLKRISESSPLLMMETHSLQNFQLYCR